ncbi:MAG: hypothetical protein H6765_06370 [Candidatus Peribacteria bacterium]|nr:MAG: hypothetical protein H6765_06370 [Candidatus Peribacteria bacterium]
MCLSELEQASITVSIIRTSSIYHCNRPMNKLNNFFFKQVSPWTLAWLRVGTGITLIMHMIGAKALL